MAIRRWGAHRTARGTVSDLRVGRGRLACVLVVLALVASATLTPRLSAQPGERDKFAYQIPFPPAPTDGATAIATLYTRREIVVSQQACGSELEFSQLLGSTGEASTALVIAKVAWAGTHPASVTSQQTTTRCRFARFAISCDVFLAIQRGEQCEGASFAAFETNEWATLKKGDAAPFNDWVRSQVPGCPTGVADSVRVQPGADLVKFFFGIDVRCLAAQASVALTRMTVDRQMGTDKSPCPALFGESTGDWDMSVRNLTRVAYLDDRFHLLDAAAETNLQHQLLSAEGGPAEEKYPLGGCGNTEEASGSSQDRANERGWTDSGGFWETLGDIALFLFKLFVIFFIAFGVAVILISTLGAGIVAAVVVPVLVAAAFITLFPFIPETENHLLMINTSKYLKNQLIIRDLGAGSKSAAPYVRDQRDLKEWLLKRMRGFVAYDFIEYNSRPYHRLSISAIFNIVDYADDADLTMGARLVLDYQFAKFAVGSEQGRRFVPYRRTRTAMTQNIDTSASGPNGIFDLIKAGDQQVGLGLFFAGQTQQLPDMMVSLGMPAQALYAATSHRYSPEALVVDLAIRKETPLFQRIGHFTGEIYSSGRSFLISAGGTATGLAYTPTQIEDLDLAFKPDRRDDLGVGLPTTLLLANDTIGAPLGRPVRTTLGELIRIEGKRPDDREYPSYDGNLCVWDGFACGLNVSIPVPNGRDPSSGFSPNQQIVGAVGPCMSKGPAGSQPEWDFIDSSRCQAYLHSPRFFIAIYRQACVAGADLCQDNFGFFEIVDAEVNSDFDAFKRKVVAANPPGFVTGRASDPSDGTYHSARGQAIEFSIPGASDNYSESRVASVDRMVQLPWTGAVGSPQLVAGTKTPITSSGDGIIRIWNPRLKQTLELDYRDVNHPKRSVY